jgi:polygalacturonase
MNCYINKIILFVLLIIPGTCVLAQVKSLPVVKTSFRKDSVTITKFGAVPDGLFLNTESINKAVDAMHKKGGGVVVIPAGMWVTGPVILKSNVNKRKSSFKAQCSSAVHKRFLTIQTYCYQLGRFASNA